MDYTPPCTQIGWSMFSHRLSPSLTIRLRLRSSRCKLQSHTMWSLDWTAAPQGQLASSALPSLYSHCRWGPLPARNHV